METWEDKQSHYGAALGTINACTTNKKIFTKKKNNRELDGGGIKRGVW